MTVSLHQENQTYTLRVEGHMNPVKVVKGFKVFFSNISKLFSLFSEFRNYFLLGSKQVACYLHVVLA